MNELFQNYVWCSLFVTIKNWFVKPNINDSFWRGTKFINYDIGQWPVHVPQVYSWIHPIVIVTFACSEILLANLMSKDFYSEIIHQNLCYGNSYFLKLDP